MRKAIHVTCDIIAFITASVAFSQSKEEKKHAALWQQPTPEQYATLEKAGRLEGLAEQTPLRVDNGSAVIRFSLPRQAVSLVVVEWE